MIGRDGVDAFWLLVQHLTDFEFQRSLLPFVERAFSNGSIQAQDYALFVDRLLVREGKPQRYGTQIREWKDKAPIPYAIENPNRVNTVRASIGLFNLEDYLVLVKQAYFPDDTDSGFFSNLATEEDQGSVGLQLDVRGSGPIEDMTIQSLVVSEVAKTSPAEQAGIQIGDQIIEIDGLPVAGNSTSMLMPAMDKPIGDKITMVVRSSNGIERKVTLVITTLSSE